MMREPLKWYEDDADNPPWIKALAELRAKVGAITMSKQSSWLLINMPKRRSVTESSS